MATTICSLDLPDQHESHPHRTPGDQSETAAPRNADDAARTSSDRVSLQLREARTAGSAAWRQCQADIIVDHLWLARAVAKRYRQRGEDDDDLFQVACVGLVQAVRRFDPDHGDFLAFAVPTIAGVVKRHFRDHGWLIRPPRRTQEAVADLRGQWCELAQELGRSPNEGELAERLGYARSDVAEARCASQGYSSAALDALSQGQTPDAADGRDFDGVEERLVVQRALQQLDEEKRHLIWMRFYEGRTQSDIAAEMGTSQMQISRRLTRLCVELRTIVGTLTC